MFYKITNKLQNNPDIIVFVVVMNFVEHFQKDEIEAGEQEVANKSDKIKTIKERLVITF